MTPQSFIATMLSLAQENQQKFKIPTSVCIAQSALETGWGRSVVGNNYFGIKAVPSSTQQEYSSTMEFIGGKWICIKANFSSYASLADCINQYGLFLKHPRFAPCFQTETPQDFCMELQICGYATDPNYGEKLITIINQFNLTQYDLSTPHISTILPSNSSITT